MFEIFLVIGILKRMLSIPINCDENDGEGRKENAWGLTGADHLTQHFLNVHSVRSK